MRKAIFILGLTVCAGVIGCGSEHAGITIDLGIRNLCGGEYGVISGEEEGRCSLCPDGYTCSNNNVCIKDQCASGVCTSGACTPDNNTCKTSNPNIPLCWQSDNRNLREGFCRQCDQTHACSGGKTCDHGWCHAYCTDSSKCLANEFCTDNLCRKPNFVDATICNSGSRKLEIYTDKTEIHGYADACAFARLQWEATGTIILQKGECTSLRINFTPLIVGNDYRAYVIIHSNDPAKNTFPLFLCGKGSETKCADKTDVGCGDLCPSCKLEDFSAELVAATPTCDVNNYK
jgi:hypothetical protein